MALSVKQETPIHRTSTWEAKSQLDTTVTQQTGATSDGSTGEATSQLATKVVVPPVKPQPKTGPAATTK